VFFIAPLLALFVATAQVFGITSLSYRLSITPDNMQSRVGTAFRLVVWSSFPVGAGIAGLLLQQFGPATTSWVFGAWVLAIALFSSRPRGGLRNISIDPSAATF
jgi:hypothetical protein